MDIEEKKAWQVEEELGTKVDKLMKRVDALNQRIDTFEHVKIDVVNKVKSFPLPEYKTLQSAGLDLRAAIDLPVLLYPGDHHLFPTGLRIGLPPGYEAQVRPRSGLACEHGLSVLNTPGTIDADYRGEIHVDLVNHGHQPFRVECGMRIAQLVIARVIHATLNPVDELDTTERNDHGHGSTGIY